MSAYAPNGTSNGSAGGQNNGHTVTALSRWSVLNKQLPAVNTIKHLHVYDFDNTLFKTPLPNPALWNVSTIGQLANVEAFVGGGWWHDARILAATGDGIEKEEPRKWEGWWNEKIVQLVQLSMQQKDALCVLLTGRSEQGFTELIKRMVAAKGLEFDMMGLKPAVSPTNQRFKSTMNFKQMFLEAMMETYRHATEIRVYEDRVKHVKQFRDFFADYNREQQYAPTRGPITAEVVQVAELSTVLDPVVEVGEIQKMINEHNEAIAKVPGYGARERLAINKTVYFTGYMISPEDSERLSQLIDLPPHMKSTDLKIQANTIIISQKPCPPGLLEEVGGMGSKMTWEVTGVGNWQNSIWAACVQPVPRESRYHVETRPAYVVLAVKYGARLADASKISDWRSVPSMVLETTVGEKAVLRIEREGAWNSDGHGGMIPTKPAGHKRKYNGDDDYARNNQQGGGARGYHSFSHGGGRGAGGPHGRGGFRGGGGAGGPANRGNRNASRGQGKGSRGGRGGGHGHGYRSLDDVDPKIGHPGVPSYQREVVDYEDSHPPLGAPAYQPPTGLQFSGQQGQQGQAGQAGYSPWAPQGGQSHGQGQGQARPGPGPGAGGLGAQGADLQNFY